MTPTQRRECLDAIGWSQRGLAASIGMDESTIRRLFREDRASAPAGLDTWLRRAAQWHRENPPPGKPGRANEKSARRTT